MTAALRRLAAHVRLACARRLDRLVDELFEDAYLGPG